MRSGMICISINQESRRLALFDMYNASRQCDLLEIRLDRFGKAPELAEILQNKPRPVIMCCRRTQDGGYWDGSEEERLALLRQCIISKADYVEIELDVADKIRRFPPSQRVISYTNLSETPANIVDIYEEARLKNPDVIKLTTLARTPEEAWPLVQILAKATTPTVVVGLGKAGVMLSVLGMKIGAPWVYAALEKGMEAYPGQATVHDYEHIYHLRTIEKTTRFVGVTGFGQRERTTIAALNAVLEHERFHFRCLPMGVGDVRIFRKVMDAVKLGAAIVNPAHQSALAEVASVLHGAAKFTQATDLLVHKGDEWHGFHTGCQTWIDAITTALKAKTGANEPLKDRMVMIVGINGPAKMLAAEVQRLGGSAILTSRQRKAGQQVAQTIGCRYVQFEAIYSTLHDVLIVCDEEKENVAGQEVAGLHSSYLKDGMIVMDLTAGIALTPLLHEAQGRGCIIISPRQLLVEQVAVQAKILTGKAAPREILERVITVEEE